MNCFLGFFAFNSINFSVLFQHLEAVIRARIPSIISLINKNIDELEAELDRLGRPIGVDAGVSMFFSITTPQC